MRHSFLLLAATAGLLLTRAAAGQVVISVPPPPKPVAATEGTQAEPEHPAPRLGDVALARYGGHRSTPRTDRGAAGYGWERGYGWGGYGLAGGRYYPGYYPYLGYGGYRISLSPYGRYFSYRAWNGGYVHPYRY